MKGSSENRLQNIWKSLNNQRKKAVNQFLTVFYYGYIPLLIFLGNDLKLGLKTVNFSQIQSALSQ